MKINKAVLKDVNIDIPCLGLAKQLLHELLPDDLGPEGTLRNSARIFFPLV